MGNGDCPSFEGCKAPLCPMDDSFNNGAIWYVDADVCVSLKFRREHWYRIQRRIKKLSMVYPVDGYFTSGMLKRIMRVRKGVAGLSADAHEK
jgi:hypothetical protein